MIYGLLRITNSPDPFHLLDDVYFNKQITCFDTANCYGMSETIFGDWMVSRNINRNNIRIICKGGHHSYDNKLIHRVNEEDIKYDLQVSFQRLKITYADVFMFHRDDETIYPEKIYDICNYLLENKWCNKIGVSNWSTRRIESVNYISNIKKGISIIEESQIFLNYIKLSFVPYPNIHKIDYDDYMWYMKHPQHKIQIYSVACFVNELDNSFHQNKIFKQILEYICNITNESKQTILYVLLSNCGLNVECIQGSISPSHILTKTKINIIYSIIQKIPNFEYINCFLVERPIGTPKNNMISFLMNGFVGPFPLKEVEEKKVDSIVNWLLEKKFNDYKQMKFHHEHNADIKELCSNQILNDIVTEYIGYECICYNTEFFVRENNDDFAYTANWHIDPYIGMDDTYPHFTLQIGLTDNNYNNSLEVIVGSHLFDYQQKYNTINKNDYFAPLVNLDETKLDSSLVYKMLNKKSFVYLFSNYVTHGKGIIKNNTNVRVALTLRIISKKSIINTMHNFHISNDKFTLGTSNPDCACSDVAYKSVQNTYKSMFS